MTKTYELPNEKMIMADVDEKHHTATVSVYALDDLVEAYTDEKIKIIAEIERERSFQRAIDEYDIATGLRKALEIIDKYRKGGSGE